MNVTAFLQGVAGFLVVFAALSWICGKIVEIWHQMWNHHGTVLHDELARSFGEAEPRPFTNYFYWHPLIEPLSQPRLFQLPRKTESQSDGRPPLPEVYPEGHLPGHIASETFAAVMIDPFPWPTLSEALARMLEANRVGNEGGGDSLALARQLLARRREVKAGMTWATFLGAAAGEFEDDFVQTAVAVHAADWTADQPEDPMVRLAACWNRNLIVPERLRARMLLLIHEAQGDMDQLREAVARWYRETMDRVSGRFQRQSMAKVFVVAAFICLFLNVDMLIIGDALLAALRGAGEEIPPEIFRPAIGGTLLPPLEAARAVTGALISAALAAVGAPFWYDLLDKISRRTGRGPAPRS